MRNRKPLTEEQKQVRKEACRRWAEAHPEAYKKLHREAQARWRATHIQIKRAYDTAYRSANIADCSAAQKRWHKLHPAATSAVQTAARHKRRAAGTLKATEVRQLREAEPWCAYCGKPSEHVEHCTPISRGGSNDLSNVVMACACCNKRKFNKTVLEFLF
jgi:5-methylcytosine-specific restriction endonuclease McrA